MAKVIITLQDIEDDVDVKFSFEPALNKESPTPAQEYALGFAALLRGEAEECEVGFEDDE